MQNRGQRTGRRTVAAMAAAGLIMAMSVGLLTGVPIQRSWSRQVLHRMTVPDRQ